ncbi:ATP-binding cassette domain-containing protein [Hamadaea tsunoensis]|uniref:ATP-binding cassette domain-containing protein n=1 Tax=Hamadaea tsunoensis TaxID=53368 RepID=UPI00054FCA51|nr:ABC transporter ATP-binding protein [Hamadaea tsunoensis]
MRCEDLWLRYARSGPWVLQGISASLGPGEVVVLAGRNGAGKSTLLQVLAGVLTPTRGRVVDRPRRVGWVPEKFPADQPFTTRRYLRHMSAVLGHGSGSVDAWLERLGLSAYADVDLKDLSKGTAQKVGLAQAMIGEPELLVLDEPWEGLDVATRDLVPELVREVAAAGGRTLVSDHRGETAKLPEATVWSLVDGTLAVRETQAADCVVEISVPAHQVAVAVAAWRAQGHNILRVREPERTVQS